MKFNNETDVHEYIVITNGIINAFADRGYGLYELGRAPMMFTDMNMVMEFVQFGRTEDVMEADIRYLPLPLIKDSTDRFQMGKAIEEMVRQLRGPYYMDLQSEPNGSVTCLGKHLIDTVMLDPPFLNLITDVKFSQATTENVIELDLATAAYTIRRQVMMAFRSTTVKLVTEHSNLPVM